LRRARHFLIESANLSDIVDAIPQGYDVIAPVKQEWAVNLAKIDSSADLALGWKSDEHPGRYRLRRAATGLEGARPMTSPKWFTHRPIETLSNARRDENGDWQYETPMAPTVKQAFFGVRACDVSGMLVMDRTFNRQFHDAQYDAARRNNIIIGISCFDPGNNCFCSTFNTGPELKDGFDIGLSDFNDKYLIEVATDAGAKIIAGVDVKPAGRRLLEIKEERTAAARRRMARAFDLQKAVKVLNANYDHPYWQEPSARCLSCANCINVCPTCYCYQIDDKSNLAQTETSRERRWDACQNLEFAAVHGGNFRPKRVDRIRQWCNHKLNWTIEQYGCAGCVGCGRCITWCPTAIDITEPVWRLGGRAMKLAA